MAPAAGASAPRCLLSELGCGGTARPATWPHGGALWPRLSLVATSTLAFLHLIRAASIYSPVCLACMHYFSKAKIKLQEAVETQESERFPAGSAKVSEDLHVGSSPIMATWVGALGNANEASAEGEPASPAPWVRRDRASATQGCVIWGKPGPHSAAIASAVDGYYASLRRGRHRMETHPCHRTWDSC